MMHNLQLLAKQPVFDALEIKVQVAMIINHRCPRD